MDLTLFKENYYITSQEPVYTFFDVQLRDEIDADDDLVSAINDYIEHDEVIPTDDAVTYFIYTIDGEEIYVTDQEQELLDKVKELAEELNGRYRDMLIRDISEVIDVFYYRLYDVFNEEIEYNTEYLNSFSMEELQEEFDYQRKRLDVLNKAKMFMD